MPNIIESFKKKLKTIKTKLQDNIISILATGSRVIYKIIVFFFPLKAYQEAELAKRRVKKVSQHLKNAKPFLGKRPITAFILGSGRGGGGCHRLV